MKDFNPTHPGKILFEEFMKPLGISQSRLAKDLGVPAMRINKIVHGKRSLSADTALRLSRYFGTSPEFWMNIQSHYDIEMAKITLGDTLAEVKIFAEETRGDAPIWKPEDRDKP
ncbi:HigA family addiction module antitoxin [Desulfoluna spongiiphila]|uniref:Addiction module antidote protein, HigA family n=1 Tax=Desulfoluna spongiiphila TaxID=419481 RepID=A0A1G5J7K0_9BACT|nr:HigA family addiction module antitoxin [Desulfoluna spongiiphila]SCY84335.1 addiction module antidote protein, HigA family [Desulfoluna spongiiphila]